VPPPVVNPRQQATEPWVAGTTWTGGQYSLARALFGAWLFAGFVRLLPWDPAWIAAAGEHAAGFGRSLVRLVPNVLSWSAEPWVGTALLLAGAVASLSFAVGAWHRVAAGVVAYAWLCVWRAAPSLPTPGMPWILGLLLAHFTLPPAPYGSWTARGRADPEGGWRIHLPVFQLAWALLLLASVMGVFEKLSSGAWRSGGELAARGVALPASALQLVAWLGIAVEAALPIAVFRKRPRAIAWSAALAWRLLVLTLGGADERLRGLLVAHLLAFDPLWLPPLRASAREHLFFDGTCGLCHRIVRFVAAEDRGSAFFYSPLEGETIRGLLTDAQRAALPDSVVVRTDRGQLVLRSDAWIHVLRRLGGAWRAFGALLAVVPRPIRDVLYLLVARTRRLFFARPKESCPLLSTRLRGYFLP